jgi:predicted MFS family arabinose efflux permease
MTLVLHRPKPQFKMNAISAREPTITPPTPVITPALTFLLALACGMIVANIYYIQPLAAPVAQEVGLPASATGLLVTFTQIGYGLGLIFVVPIGDIIAGRQLIVTVLCLLTLALIILSVAISWPFVLIASLLVGITSVVAQVIVPFAGNLAPDSSRGRVVGNVMSGLLFGIMLARPVASFLAHWFGWRSIFVISAVAMAALALVLKRQLPDRQPSTRLSYKGILRSLPGYVRDYPLLRRRAFYHAALFGSFSLFWTGVPLLLVQRPFGFDQRGIALFSLAGAAGALVAPVAGRIADLGLTRPLTGAAISCVAMSFLLCLWAAQIQSVAGLVFAAILLDMGVSINLISSQRAIFALGAETRSRFNGLFMAFFFGGGAIGSALAGWTFDEGGWTLTCWTGVAFGFGALLYYATEFWSSSPPLDRNH